MKIIFCNNDTTKLDNVRSDIGRVVRQLDNTNYKLKNPNFNIWGVIDMTLSVFITVMSFLHCYIIRQSNIAVVFFFIGVFGVIWIGVMTAAYFMDNMAAGLIVFGLEKLYEYASRETISKNKKMMEDLKNISSRLSLYTRDIRLAEDIQRIMDISDIPVDIDIIRTEQSTYKLVFKFKPVDDGHIVPDIKKINDTEGKITYDIPEEISICITETDCKILRKDTIDFSYYDKKVYDILEEYYDIIPDARPKKELHEILEEMDVKPGTIVRM